MVRPLPDPEQILVVDDEPCMRAVLGAMLRRAGYHVEFASNGREAIHAARVRPPRLILVDMSMPVMNGEAFLRTRAHDHRLSDIPVVCMSALHDVRTCALQLGAQAFLPKPFRMQALLDTVASCVASPLARSA